MRETFLSRKTLFYKSQWWECAKMSSKGGIQTSEKKEGFEKGRTNLEGRKRVKTYRECKN